MVGKRVTGALIAVSLLLLAAPSAIAATPHKHYYLALGDSLSVGYQPKPTGGPVGVETKQGYVNDLFARYSKRVKHLKLVQLGCPHESTGSFITGQGNPQAALFNCNPGGRSQLKQAVSFLKTHHARGEVPLITIDLGANDIDNCPTLGTTAAILACVNQGETAIQTNTPKILKALRKAAPKGTRFAAMNLYDPILAGELSPSSGQQTLANLSLVLIPAINKSIASADKAAHVVTADVAAAFQTYDQTPETFMGQQVPTDVVQICKLTWMCAPPPQGPNIHANPAGYQVIAGAFEKVIGKLG